MRPSEEWAQINLAEYLARKGMTFSFKQGANPPDLVFDVEGEEWAVEVTELHQYIDAGREQSTKTIECCLFYLFKKIDHETASRSRGYTVSLKGPLTRGQEQKILTEAKYHILASKDEPWPIGEKGECQVTPLKAGDTALNCIIMADGTAKIPASNVMVADIQRSIDYALGRILREKVPRLSQFAHCKKRVLVIVSEYVFADSENVRIGLQERRGAIAPIDEIYLSWDSSFEVVYP